MSVFFICVFLGRVISGSKTQDSITPLQDFKLAPETHRHQDSHKLSQFCFDPLRNIAFRLFKTFSCVLLLLTSSRNTAYGRAVTQHFVVDLACDSMSISFEPGIDRLI